MADRLTDAELEAMRGHTPGPWSIPHFAEPEVGCECEYLLSDTCLGAVASVHCSGEGNWLETGDNPKFAEAVANARLFHAAPNLLAELIERRAMDAELLDALSAVLDFCIDEKQAGESPTIHMARSALVKFRKLAA